MGDLSSERRYSTTAYTAGASPGQARTTCAICRRPGGRPAATELRAMGVSGTTAHADCLGLPARSRSGLNRRK